MMRDTVDGLRRTIAATEAARGSVEELPSLAKHRGPSTSKTQTLDLSSVPNKSFIDVLDFFTDPPQFDPEDWTFLEEVRESYAYDDQDLRIFRGIDVHEMEALRVQGPHSAFSHPTPYSPLDIIIDS
ncbi:unnamed protein product [Calypogeia fissa]